jgi:hypothetical protein
VDMFIKSFYEKWLSFPILIACFGLIYLFFQSFAKRHPMMIVVLYCERSSEGSSYE